MDEILIQGIRIYAYHGCLLEEGKIGGEYEVDVRILFDTKQSQETDRIAETVDYTKVYHVVKEQMAIRSKLIEHVAARIAGELKKIKPEAEFNVTVSKINPPVGGAIKRVSVTVQR